MSDTKPHFIETLTRGGHTLRRQSDEDTGAPLKTFEVVAQGDDTVIVSGGLDSLAEDLEWVAERTEDENDRSDLLAIREALSLVAAADARYLASIDDDDARYLRGGLT